MSFNQWDRSENENQKFIETDGNRTGVRQVSFDYPHHEIHQGNHFYICDYDGDIAVSEVIEFIVVTPDSDTEAHMLFEFNSSLGATLEVYEGASTIAGGSSVTPNNNDRNSSNASVLTITKDPTSIGSDGTKKAGFIVGGNRESGFNNRDKELILKQNTTYLFRFTSLANSNTIGFCGEWYEHSR